MNGTKSTRTVKAINAVKIFFIVITAIAAITYTVKGVVRVNDVEAAKDYTLEKEIVFTRMTDALEEEYEDETVCPVEFIAVDGVHYLTVNYSYEEWENLPSDAEVTGYVYSAASGDDLCFDREVGEEELKDALRNKNADDAAPVFGGAMALALVCIALGVITVFGKMFTAYEQIWFISIMAIAAVISVLFPEEDCNGVNGLVIMALYLADTFLNILCELLISKQSKWNFIVSVFVELTEIAICIVLAYRFATLASTLFFWLPCDIISFVNWHKHPDKVEEELTEVRTLKGWQEVAIIAGIVVWTLGIGWLLTTINVDSDFFKDNDTLRIVICYLDACVSAVGIVNGVFILLRLREQWIAWYISAFIEAAINIMTGQFVLLVLKVGYITNTTYGYIKWTRYIRGGSAKDEAETAAVENVPSDK